MKELDDLLKVITDDERKVIFSVYKKYYASYSFCRYDLIMNAYAELQAHKQEFDQIENRDDKMIQMFRLCGRVIKKQLKDDKKTISLETPIFDNQKTLADYIPAKENEPFDITKEELKQIIKSILKNYSKQDVEIIKAKINKTAIQTIEKRYKKTYLYITNLLNNFRENLQIKLLETNKITNNFFENRIVNKRQVEFAKYYKKLEKQATEKILSPSAYKTYRAKANKMQISIDEYIKKYIRKTYFNNMLAEQNKVDTVAQILSLPQYKVIQKINNINTHFFLFEIKKIKDVLYPNYTLKQLVGAIC